MQWWKLAIGLVIGLVLSAGVGFYAWDRGVEESIAFVLGLVTLVLVLQLDQIVRTERVVDRAQDQAALWQKIEQSPLMRESMKEIINGAASIDAMPDNEIFVRIAREKPEECNNDIRELARARIRTTPDRFLEVVMPLAERVEDTIHAVAVRNPLGTFEWWDTRSGKEYWKFNKKVMDRRRRRERIERIFVYQADKNGKMPQPLQDLVEHQCKEGVDVYTVEAKRIRTDLRVVMAVFDENFLFELQVSHDGEPQQYFCSRHDSDISRSLIRFNRIKSEAETYDCKDTDKEELPWWQSIWRRDSGS